VQALGTALSVGGFLSFGLVVVGLRFSVRITAAELAWPALSSLGVLAAVIGATVPMWGPWLDCLRAYRRLHPLWLALSRAHPEIVLHPPGSIRLDPWKPWHINYRLFRHAIEIRDGWREARPYMAPDIAIQARERGQRAGLDGQDLQAAVTAATLAATLRAHAADQTPHQYPVPYDGIGGHDLGTEVAWLTKVAAAFAQLSVTAGNAGPGQDPAPRPQAAPL
jgi:hypothetical protein